MKIIKKGNKHKVPKWTCIQECERCGSVLEVGLKDIYGYWWRNDFKKYVSLPSIFYSCPVCGIHNYLTPIIREELMNHLNTYHKE